MSHLLSKPMRVGLLSFDFWVGGGSKLSRSIQFPTGRAWSFLTLHEATSGLRSMGPVPSMERASHQEQLAIPITNMNPSQSITWWKQKDMNGTRSHRPSGYLH